MDDLLRATDAQNSVIGSMLIDDKCVPLVLSKLREEDFIDPICRNFFRAIRSLSLAGKPVDPVTVSGELKAGNDYVRWVKEITDVTPTAANVEMYIGQVLEASMLYRFRELCDLGMKCFDSTQAEELARKMSLVFSATDRMPRMTGAERFAALVEDLKNPEKPKYLPWGFPTVDRAAYAELGDMILLGGYSSSGKTLLSILMATAQARAGYKVGYYSLETSPKKMTVRQTSALGQIPLERLKKKNLLDSDWPKIAEAASIGAGEGSYTIMQAAGSTVDDIISDALGHGYQVVYVDYVQRLRVAGLRVDNPRVVVSEVSQRLKDFAQSTKTAVVALAQLSRPETVLVDDRDEKGQKVKRKVIIAPSMHSFKESGQLEQDADLAFLLWAKDYENNDSNRILKIGKNKEGFRKSVELVFHGETQTMVELEPREDRSVAAELAAKGRAVKQANRAKAQMGLRELEDNVSDNPFANTSE